MRHPMPHRQRGFVLIASLLIMVVLTILAVSMFRSFGLQEKMAGNLREKQRAFDIGQNALMFAQNWLSAPANTTGAIDCANAAATMGADNTPIICKSTSPWQPSSADLQTTLLGAGAGSAYNPGGPAAITVSTSGGNDTIWALPRVVIQSIGNQAGTGRPLYRITAAAYGGNQNAVAVVQSIYATGGTPGAKDLGAL